MKLQLTGAPAANALRTCLRLAVLFGIAGTIMLVTGCATQPPVDEVKKIEYQTVWPMPPEQPRIRYLGELNVVDLGEQKMTLSDMLLGKDQEPISGLSKPYAVYSDSKGRVFVADTGITGLVVFDLNQKNRASLWGVTGNGALIKPTGVTSDELGNVYVSDPLNNRVVVFDSNGKFIDAYGGKETLESPNGLAFNEQTQRLYVVDTKKHHVIVFDRDGNVDFTIGTNGAAPGFFNFPTNIAIDSSGRLYVADMMNFRVQVLEPDGTYIRHIGQVGQRVGDFFRLKGVGVDTQEHIYAVDASFQNFQIFDSQGQLLLYVGDGGSEPGKFALPAGMHVDKNNRIFIADQYNQRIQMFEYVGDAGENESG